MSYRDSGLCKTRLLSIDHRHIESNKALQRSKYIQIRTVSQDRDPRLKFNGVDKRDAQGFQIDMKGPSSLVENERAKSRDFMNV